MEQKKGMVSMHLERKIGFYEKYVKRLLDIMFALVFMVVFCWLYVLIALLVRVKLGSPVLFCQPRPGIIGESGETLFDMYKFRSMTDERDENGNLLPDEQRLTKIGEVLRSTSLDELPQLFCVLKGTMSLVGPRPQLVRDMLFMTDEQRMRHTARPGITGLAQVRGRNAVTWEEKLEWDLRYIESVSFWNDAKILFETVAVVFRRNGITDGEAATSLNLGTALWKAGKITLTQYYSGLVSSEKLIAEYETEKAQHSRGRKKAAGGCAGECVEE
ncbi:sugar transferase [[Clostridium] aminophilum]|nr:sugar transferase [[Clostridium] aminophilum]